MSFYPNVSENDLINLRKLGEQQKNERAHKINNKILKQTHDIKLAESLSPFTKKLDETIEKLGHVIRESTQNLGNVIKDNNTPQPAIEQTPTTQQPIENNQDDTQPGILYDVSLENTLTNMKKKKKDFLK